MENGNASRIEDTTTGVLVDGSFMEELLAVQVLE